MIPYHYKFKSYYLPYFAGWILEQTHFRTKCIVCGKVERFWKDAGRREAPAFERKEGETQRGPKGQVAEGKARGWGGRAETTTATFVSTLSEAYLAGLIWFSIWLIREEREREAKEEKERQERLEKERIEKEQKEREAAEKLEKLEMNDRVVAKQRAREEELGNSN